MKKLLLILLFPSFAFCEGPLFRQQEPSLQQEFENVYQDLRATKLKVNSSGNPCIDTPTLCIDITNHRVGIGIASPVTPFNIVGSGTNAFRLTDASNYTLDMGYSGTGNEARIGTLGSTADLTFATNSTTRIFIDGTGPVTMPTQPSFLVTDGTGASNVTGDGTTYTDQWPTEVYDKASNFSASTFTAPVDGKYLLQASIEYTDALVGHALRSMTITTSNRTYSVVASYSLAESVNTLNLSVLADMDANDTAIVTIRLTGSTKTISVAASASPNYFSGSLIN